MAISLHDMPMFEVKFLKNGSKFLNNTSSPTKREYSLSYQIGQLADWFIWKEIFSNMGRSIVKKITSRFWEIRLQT